MSTTPVTETNTQPKLTEEQLAKVREIPFSINLKGLVKAWNKLFYDAPFNIYQTVARKAEGVSRKWMTGFASVLGMPAGIILRNTSRAAHNCSEGKYLYSSRIVGGLVAGAASIGSAWWGAGLIGGALGSGFLAAGAGWVVAGTVALAVMVPVFSIATLASASLVAGVVAVLSTIPAVINLPPALERNKLAAKGIKVSEAELEAIEAKFDSESPTVRYQQKQFQTVSNGLYYLSKENKKEIYLSLKGEFEKAAEAETKADTAAETAAPAAEKTAEASTQSKPAADPAV